MTLSFIKQVLRQLRTVEYAFSTSPVTLILVETVKPCILILPEPNKTSIFLPCVIVVEQTIPKQK